MAEITMAEAVVQGSKFWGWSMYGLGAIGPGDWRGFCWWKSL